MIILLGATSCICSSSPFWGSCRARGLVAGGGLWRVPVPGTAEMKNRCEAASSFEKRRVAGGDQGLNGFLRSIRQTTPGR